MAGDAAEPKKEVLQNATPKLDRGQITNLLTLIIVGVWIITAVVRIWVPWPEAAILDSAMPVVIAYWFLSAGMTRKNGHAENGAS